jgi:hypothetical protein
VSLILDEHREYLADTSRIDAFARALREVVRPGDVVLDLASGTGILGFLALQAGAARVYAVDDGPIIDIARRMAAANGFTDPHRFRRRTKKVAAILPGSVTVRPHEAGIGFVDECGRLQRMVGPFGHHPRRGQLFEFVIDQWQ